jgi:hypothetical protein
VIHREVPSSIEPPYVAAIYAIDEGAASASPPSPPPNPASCAILSNRAPPLRFFRPRRHHPPEPHPRRQDLSPCVTHTRVVRRSCTREECMPLGEHLTSLSVSGSPALYVFSYLQCI